MALSNIDLGMPPTTPAKMQKAGYIGQGMEQIWDPNLLGFEIVFPCEWKTKKTPTTPTSTPAATNKVSPPEYLTIPSDAMMMGIARKRKKSFSSRNRNSSTEEKRAATSTSASSSPVPPLPPIPRVRRIHDQTPSRWICSGGGGGPRSCRASNPGLESLFSDDESPDVEELCCSNPNCSLTLMNGIKAGRAAVWIQNRYSEYLGA